MFLRVFRVVDCATEHESPGIGLRPFLWRSRAGICNLACLFLCTQIAFSHVNPLVVVGRRLATATAARKRQGLKLSLAELA